MVLVRHKLIQVPGIKFPGAEVHRCRKIKFIMQSVALLRADCMLNLINPSVPWHAY